jgi:hypothetical protein
MEEVWKDIQNYEGLYQISNLGRIKSIKRNIYLKQRLTKDYYRINLYNNNVVKSYFVHRLIGFAFIPNPNNLLEIDHIDRNKKNNNLSNLRWVTRSDNAINTTRCINTSGQRNIIQTFDNDKTFYRVIIKRNNIKITDKRFEILEEAIEYRDNYLNNLIDE